MKYSVGRSPKRIITGLIKIDKPVLATSKLHSKKDFLTTSEKKLTSAERINR